MPSIDCAGRKTGEGEFVLRALPHRRTAPITVKLCFGQMAVGGLRHDDHALADARLQPVRASACPSTIAGVRVGVEIAAAVDLAGQIGDDAFACADRRPGR